MAERERKKTIAEDLQTREACKHRQTNRHKIKRTDKRNSQRKIKKRQTDRQMQRKRQKI